MTSSPTTTEGLPLCSTRKDFRSACFGAASFGDAGKPYCLFHFPSNKKSQAFRVALEERLEKKNYDFRGVWFPDEVSFAGRSGVAHGPFRSTINESNWPFSSLSLPCAACKSVSRAVSRLRKRSSS